MHSFGSQQPMYTSRFAQTSFVSFRSSPVLACILSQSKCRPSRMLILAKDTRCGKPQDRKNRRGTHPKDFWVRILDLDPNRKSLSDPHPVKVSFNKRYSLNLDVIILGLDRGRDPLENTLKTPLRLRYKVDLS